VHQVGFICKIIISTFSETSRLLLVLLYPEDKVIRSFETSKNCSSGDTASYNVPIISSIATRLKICLSILRFQREPLRWLQALQFDQNHFKHCIPESNFGTFLLWEGICEAKWLHPNPAPKIDKSFCELVDMQTSSVVWNDVINLTYGEAPLGLTVKPDKRQSKLSNLLISYKFHYTTEIRSEINFQSYGTVTGKSAGRVRNRDWIPGKGKRYIAFLKRQNWLRGGPSLLFVSAGCSFPGCKGSGAWRRPFKLPSSAGLKH
jgi:hypothetical protein